MGPAGLLEFKPESEVTVSVMTQAGPGSRSAATADHDNHVVFLTMCPSEKLSEARLESVRLRVMILSVILRSRGNIGCAGRPGVRVCQGRQVASVGAAAAGPPVPPVTPPGLGLPVPQPGGRPPGARIQENVH
jgi:hypothetical protein